MINWLHAEIQVRRLKRGIRAGEWERLLLMQCTFAPLSQCTKMLLAVHSFPHRKPLQREGKAWITLRTVVWPGAAVAKETRTNDLGKIPWNWLRGRRLWTVGYRRGTKRNGYRKRIGRFNWFRNVNHNLSSSRHAWVMKMRSSSKWTEDASERRCDMKVRPCGMMRIAKFRWPSRDSILHLEQFELLRRVDETRMIRLILSLCEAVMKKIWIQRRLWRRGHVFGRSRSSFRSVSV